MVKEDRSKVMKGDGDLMDMCGIYCGPPSCGISSSFLCRSANVLDCGCGCSAAAALA